MCTVHGLPDIQRLIDYVCKLRTSESCSANWQRLIVMTVSRQVSSLTHVFESFVYCISWKWHQMQTTEFVILIQRIRTLRMSQAERTCTMIVQYNQYTWPSCHRQKESKNLNSRTEWSFYCVDYGAQLRAGSAVKIPTFVATPNCWRRFCLVSVPRGVCTNESVVANDSSMYGDYGRSITI
jgi:hypothetical protein